MRIFKNVSKRMLAVMVALLMCLSMLPGTAWAAECSESPDGKHDYSIYKVDGCGDGSLHVVSCKYCGDFTKAAHSFVDGKCVCGVEDPNYRPECKHEHTVCKPNGCEGGDGHIKSCEDCNDLNEKEPHTFVDGECVCGAKDPNYKPPCKHEHIVYKPNGCEGEDGHIKSCEDCNDLNEKEPHTFIDGECVCGAECEHKWVENETPATCTEDGKWGHYCTICGKTENGTIEALGHKEGDEIVDNDPTCEEKGNYHVKCTVCGATLKNGETPSLGHDYGETAERVDTGSDAEHTVICKNDETHTSTEAHTYSAWSEWVTSEDGANRTRTRTCDACGHTQSQSEPVSDGGDGNTTPGGGDDGNTPTPGGDDDGTTTTPPDDGGTVPPTIPDDDTENSETNIVENDIPLTENTEDQDDSEESDPAEESDEVEIGDEETPLSELPEDTDAAETELPEEDIFDEETPLAGLPEAETTEETSPEAETEEIEIPDEEIPQNDVPVTGDSSHIWVFTALLSAAGLMWLTLTGKKREFIEK